MRVAIIVLLLSTSVFAQMRGGARMGFRGGGGGFFRPHGVVGNRPSAFFHRGVVRPLGVIPQAGRPFFHGVPASVTSLGPCGFTPCFRPFFRHGFNRFGAFPFWGGIWGGGYAYPVDYGSNYVTEPQQPMVQQPSEPQRLEIVVVDQREDKQKESTQGESAPANPTHNDDPYPPATPAVFIFKDGSRKELANYAIMRGQLIDVTDGKIFRIPLEKIDREKTLEANAKAGREIQLP
jgi:hypothetical protein